MATGCMEILSTLTSPTLLLTQLCFAEVQTAITSKFNSPGWVGGFGCTESIDETLFPSKNSNVNSGQGRVTFEAPTMNSGAVQQASIVTTPGASNIAATEGTTGLTQLVTLVGITGAGLAAVFAVRNHRQSRQLKDL